MWRLNQHVLQAEEGLQRYQGLDPQKSCRTSSSGWSSWWLWLLSISEQTDCVQMMWRWKRFTYPALLLRCGVRASSHRLWWSHSNTFSFGMTKRESGISFCNHPPLWRFSLSSASRQLTGPSWSWGAQHRRLVSRLGEPQLLMSGLDVWGTKTFR